jgi:hypothetical protein
MFIYTCEYCNKNFDRRPNLIRHYARKFKCYDASQVKYIKIKDETGEIIEIFEPQKITETEPQKITETEPQKETQKIPEIEPQKITQSITQTQNITQTDTQTQKETQNMPQNETQTQKMTENVSQIETQKIPKIKIDNITELKIDDITEIETELETQKTNEIKPDIIPELETQKITEKETQIEPQKETQKMPVLETQKTEPKTEIKETRLENAKNPDIYNPEFKKAKWIFDENKKSDKLVKPKRVYKKMFNKSLRLLEQIANYNTDDEKEEEPKPKENIVIVKKDYDPIIETKIEEPQIKNDYNMSEFANALSYLNKIKGHNKTSKGFSKTREEQYFKNQLRKEYNLNDNEIIPNKQRYLNRNEKRTRPKTKKSFNVIKKSYNV